MLQGPLFLCLEPSKKKKKYRDPLKEKINEKSFLITTGSFSCLSGERHGGARACAREQQKHRVAWLGCAPRPDIKMSLSWAVSWERVGFSMEQDWWELSPAPGRERRGSLCTDTAGPGSERDGKRQAGGETSNFTKANNAPGGSGK